MQVQETSAEGLKREFKVVVPADEIESNVVQRLNEIGSAVKVPGFRPGKVPISLLKTRYGAAVRGEVLERTIQNSWQKALTEKGLRPATEPKVEIVTFEDGVDLEYKLAVELMPEIEPVNFSGIELVRRVVKVSDEEIDRTIQRLAENQRSFAAEEGRAAQTGDRLLLDFVGRIGGEEFAGGTVSDFELELGTGSFLAGFEEQLVGAKPGEKREVKVEVAEDHSNDQLRGKEVAFDVTVKEVRAPTAVAVDDALAQANGLENLNALKASVREEIEREYVQLSRTQLKRSLLDRLSESQNFDLPQGIVDAEFEVIWKQVEDARARDALDEEDKAKTEEELKASYREIAERRVQLGLLLSEIGRANNITVTQDDLNRVMRREASRFPGQEGRVLEYFQKTPQALQELQAPIFEDKVVDFIFEMANITEEEVSAEELMREPGAPEERAADDSSGQGSGKSEAKGRKRSRRKAADNGE